MFVQSVHHSLRVKEQLSRINIRFYLETIDHLFKLQQHFVWESQ